MPSRPRSSALLGVKTFKRPMPRLPFFRLGQAPETPGLPALAESALSISLEGLSVGVDNLRHDVALSPRFLDAARAQMARLIVRHGEVEGLLAAEAPATTSVPSWMRPRGLAAAKSEPTDWKSLLAQLHLTALKRSKREEKISLDQLARLAVVKFLRAEMNLQFAQVLERCRILLKSYDDGRQRKALEYREHVASFQVRKKIILRKVGQDLFLTLREIEKESLARTRRSLFGEDAANAGSNSYALFINRLVFSEDGRDDYLCAEHYVMLGNWDRDADRYGRLREITSAFLRTIYGEGTSGESIDAWMCAPENARALVGSGTPDDATDEGLAQQERLAVWVRLLEDEAVMEYVIAAYHVVPLLGEYAPRINPQQLKNALI